MGKLRETLAHPDLGIVVEAAVAREPELALARTVLAHRHRDYAKAIEQLVSVQHTIRRIGGNHVQRDLF